MNRSRHVGLWVAMYEARDRYLVRVDNNMINGVLVILPPLGRRMAQGEIAFFSRPSSSAVKIVAPSIEDPSSPKQSPKRGACSPQP